MSEKFNALSLYKLHCHNILSYVTQIIPYSFPRARQVVILSKKTFNYIVMHSKHVCLIITEYIFFHIILLENIYSRITLTIGSIGNDLKSYNIG